MMKNAFSLEQLTGKVGMIICTRGHGTLIINGKNYQVSRGMIAITSPILMLSLGECDEDFELVTMLTKIENMLPNAQKVFNRGIPIMVLQKPVAQVDAEDLCLVMDRMAELEKLERMKEMDNGSGVLKMFFEQSKIQLTTSTFMMLLGKYYAPAINQVTRQDISKDFQLASQFLMLLISPDNVERKVSWYAEQVHLSVGHFSAMIRKVLGQSPQQWIEIITINKAKSLLRKREKSIKEIAQELGFPEQFTFRKYFKEHAGMSPTEFRTPQE